MIIYNHFHDANLLLQHISQKDYFINGCLLTTSLQSFQFQEKGVAYIDKVLFFTSFILIIFYLKVHLFIFIWLMTQKVNHFYQGRLLDRLMFTSQDEVFFIQ